MILKLSANKTTVPRLHLLGTLVVLASLALALGVFFSWRNLVDQRASFDRLTQAAADVQKLRLSTELENAASHIEFARLRTENVLKTSLVEQVDSVNLLIEGVFQRERQHRPIEEIKKDIVELLRPVRFYDGRGYFFIDDLEGRVVLLPTSPELEGSVHLSIQDDTGFFVMRRQLAAVKAGQGRGFFQYRWLRPGTTVWADKLAYVRHFVPFDWLIGVGDYLEDWEKRQKEAAIERLRHIRFGGSGYVSVLDKNGEILLLPLMSNLEGRDWKNLAQFPRHILRQMVSLGARGGGMVTYQWRHSDNPSDTVSRTALVRTVQPWGWTVIVSMADNELQASLRNEIARQEQGDAQRGLNMVFALLVTLMVGGVASWAFSMWSGRLFESYHEENERQAAALRESHQRYRLLADSGQALIWSSDVEGHLDYVNQVWVDFTGRNLEQDRQHGWQVNVHLEDFARLRKAYKKAIKTLAPFGVELRFRRYDGTYRWMEAQARPQFDTSGQFQGYLGYALDITERKETEQKIYKLAFFDALTGLPNRRLMMEKLQQAVMDCHTMALRGALMFIDLDNFKSLNDTYGHAHGDALLVQVAQRLQRCVTDRDLVSRQGGDEFVVILQGLPVHPAQAYEAAAQKAQQILVSLHQPYRFPDLDYLCSSSIGIVLFGREEVSDAELMRRADMAMYEAKAAGRNTLRFFDPAMQERLSSRRQLEASLNRAVQHEEFELYYQSQVNLNGEVVGAEALIRWHDPALGLVSPGCFIPVAEQTGLIVSIGLWVLRAACQQLALWSTQPVLSNLSLAINVSPRQFRLENFADGVREILRDTGANPSLLKLEITESMLLENTDEIIAKMTNLQQLGVRFSLDDFGTGYSSLAYLKRLPFEQIKIDQSFVRDLDSDENDAIICATAISLAHSLGFKVVAEGVETTVQRDFLTNDYPCDFLQGYLFSRPLPVDEFERYVLEQSERSRPLLSSD